jgi:prepilin-type N-terminal cleavage/methylation domain-containing protein
MKRTSDYGFTLIELLIVVAIISIIAAIAVPGLLQAKMTANETSAITALKATGVAQVSYSTSCGNGAYASSFLILGTAPNAGEAPFISADLGLSATPQKSGYNLAMSAGAAGAGPNDCIGRPTSSGYYVTAVPQTFGSTGSRSFSMNAGNTVWQSTSAAAPPEPFATSATIAPIR